MDADGNYEVGDPVTLFGSSWLPSYVGLAAHVTSVESNGTFIHARLRNGLILSGSAEEFKPAPELRDAWPASDPVSRPAHYSEGMPSGVEVIDIIRAQKAGYLHGNLIKYVLRWKYKNGVEDLRKARVYLGWLIEEESNK